MGVTVGANKLSLVHKSSHLGAAVYAFPDVCVTPSPGGPVPLPYPNMSGSGQQTTTAAKTKPAGSLTAGGAYSVSRGDQAGSAGGGVLASKQMRAAQLKMQMFHVHAEMSGLPAGNPTRWHKLLDQYVILTAELYKTLSE